MVPGGRKEEVHVRRDLPTRCLVPLAFLDRKLRECQEPKRKTVTQPSSSSGPHAPPRRPQSLTVAAWWKGGDESSYSHKAGMILFSSSDRG